MTAGLEASSAKEMAKSRIFPAPDLQVDALGVARRDLVVIRDRPLGSGPRSVRVGLSTLDDVVAFARIVVPFTARPTGIAVAPEAGEVSAYRRYVGGLGRMAP